MRDELYTEVAAKITDREGCSISGLQREERIGYNRACWYVEYMVDDGIIEASHDGRFAYRTVCKKCEQHKGLVNTILVEFPADNCPHCELDLLRTEMQEFREYLSQGSKGFSDDLDQSEDMISTHDGHYVSYAEMIEACGGGSYSNDPLELIGNLRNKIEELTKADS